MRKLYLALSFWMLTVLGFGQAQKINTIVGEKVKGTFKNFLEEKEGFLYVVMEKGNKFFLRKFDSQKLSLLEEWEVGDYKHENRSLKYVCGTVGENGFYLVWEAYDRSANISYFVRQLITRKGNGGKLVEIAIADQIDKDGRAEMYLSQDSSKVAIFIPPIDKRAPKVFVYNNEWNLLWEAKAEMPIEGELFKIGQVDLTNEGDLLMVGYSYNGYESRLHLKPSSRYAVIKMGKNRKAIAYSLDHLGKVFHSLGVKPDLLDGYIVTGFYSDTKDQDAYGMFYANLNEETMKPRFEKLQLATDIYKTIQEDLGSNNSMSMYGSKGGFTGMRIKHFTKLNNGLFCVVAERDFYSLGRLDGRGFEELVVASFDAEGESVWVTIVPKIQSSGNVYLESYAFHRSENAIYLIYNDNLKNAERVNNEERVKRAISFGKNFGLIAARISENGALNMEAVASMKVTGTFVLIRSGYSPSKSTMILRAGGYGGKKFRPVSLSVE